MLKKSLLYAASIFIILLIYLLFWPVSVDPVAWQPTPAMPLSGKLAPNHLLASVERIELADGFGPEDVAIDSIGRIYGGLGDGRIVRFQADGTEPETFANTGGRPLGLHFDKSWHLIIADAYKGLLSVDQQGEIKTLTTEADGLPFKFTDDVDIADNGIIYFSDASYKFYQPEYKLDALEHRPNGRLLAYYPQTGETKTLLKDLYFANGIAVSPDQKFVLVNETWEYRVKRYWLSGEKAGEVDIFIEGLPGFPDGISSNGEGVFWLAIASPRNPLLEKLAASPFLRKVVARLPAFVHPSAIHYAFVLGLDMNGKIIYNFQEPSGEPFSFITSVQQHGDVLYLGSLELKAIGAFKLPEKGN